MFVTIFTCDLSASLFFPFHCFYFQLLTIFSDVFLMMLPIYDEIVCWKLVNTVLCDCIHHFLCLPSCF